MHKAKEKITCADLRQVLIHLYAFLLERVSTEEDILQLLETAVRICEILYLPSIQRSPKHILQLYNCTWLHHTLCRKLLSPDKGFYESYIHHIVAHAPVQFEIVSLSSTTKERLFGQANALVSQASNRHPDVMLNMLTRLQSKQLLKDKSVAETLSAQESRVSKAATHIPKYSGTVIRPAQLSHQQHSWQLHLKRISSFLVPGKGVWWSVEDGNYKFFDGYHDPNFHDEGPRLLHHHNAQIQDIYTRNEGLWQQVIDDTIPLPTTLIKIFDHKGNLKEVRRYSDVAGIVQQSASQLGNGSTGPTASLGQTLSSHTGDYSSTEAPTTYTQAGSGVQASFSPAEKIAQDHYANQ